MASHRRIAESLWFAVWWLALLLLHGVNVAYYVGAAVLYRAKRWTNVDFQLTVYSIGMNPINYYTLSTIHWVIASLHGVFMVAMVAGSIQMRQLVFLPSMSLSLAELSTRLHSSHSKAENAQRSKRNRLVHCALGFPRYVMALFNWVFGRKGLLCVESVYFDHLLLGRELIETALQTIQVYRMSYLLPHVWLIRFFVILLILNCWSTPLVHRIYHDRHFLRRLMSLLCDAVLDMVSSIAISLWIFVTYAPQYTDPVFGFPFENWFDDVWFTNMQQEFQMMLVASWADLASRLVFALGLLQGMDAIKDMLALIEATGHKDARFTMKIQTTAVAPFAGNPETLHVVTARYCTRWSRFVKFLLETAGPEFFIVLGFAILAVHTVSETRPVSTDIACQLQVRPWFVNKPACSLVELDCRELGGISGSQDSMHNAWNTFEFRATARIFVRHCPELDIPPAIQQFHQLTAFKLYNCTILSWPEEAALTKTAHPNMRALFIVRTEFRNRELPQDCRRLNFPKNYDHL